MEYQYITNPQTGRKVNVNTKLGQQIINNYASLQSGGAGGCKFNPSTQRCSKTGTQNPRWCMKNPVSGRCKKSPSGNRNAPKSHRSKAKSSPLPPGIHEVTISKVTSGEAKELAKVIADPVNGPFVVLNMAKIYLEGTPIASGNKVVFRISIQDPDYGVDYFMEQIVDEDNVSVGPEQDLWFNTVSRHTVSVRS